MRSTLSFFARGSATSDEDRFLRRLFRLGLAVVTHKFRVVSRRRWPAVGIVSKAKAMIADSKQVAPNPYADQFAQSSTNSARSMTDDKSLGLVFWRVLDALDYWLTLTQLRILDALCVEELEITADE